VKQFYVYAVHSGIINGQPAYIGVTEHPKKRLWSHRAAVAGKRQDTLTGSGLDPANISMQIMATCSERGTAETVEDALQVHYGLKTYKQKVLVK
jgi:predicted GIY-YIG superfamily endonuclease